MTSADPGTPDWLRARAHLDVGNHNMTVVPLSDALVALEAREQASRLDERERLSARVYENGWCPTCAAQPAPGGPIPGPDPGACPRCGGWRKAGMIHRCPAATPDPPREEWRVVDGDNVVCRLAGHRDFGTFRPWAEEQCRGLVERFPGESFRIERRVGDEEWEAWCPPDTPMGSCVPRCGDARCEVAAGRAAATPDPPREVTTDAGDAANGPSVPDQTRRIVVYDARHGRGGLDVPVGCTVGEAALLAAEMFGVRVGPNDRPSFGLRGTGLHASDPLPDDEDYELFVIGGTV